MWNMGLIPYYSYNLDKWESQDLLVKVRLEQSFCGAGEMYKDIDWNIDRVVVVGSWRQFICPPLEEWIHKSILWNILQHPKGVNQKYTE